MLFFAIATYTHVCRDSVIILRRSCQEQGWGQNSSASASFIAIVELSLVEVGDNQH